MAEKNELAKKNADLIDLLKIAEERIIELNEKLDNTSKPIVINFPESCIFDKSKFKAYRISLNRPHSFADDDEYNGAFNRIIVITRREFNEEFLMNALPIFLDDGANVRGQAAKCWFKVTRWIAWDDHEMFPVLLCLFTVADIQKFMDVVIDANSAMSPSDVRNLHMRVLERLVIDMQAKYQQYLDQLETAKAFTEKWKEDKEHLRKDILYEIKSLDTASRDLLDRQKIESNMIKLKMWQFLLSIAGWIGFAITIVYIILKARGVGVVPSG